jgi:ribosome modulation factor
MPRQSSAGRCVSVPHQVPMESIRSVTDAKHLALLIRHPLPAIRKAGMDAWDAGQSRSKNPYAVLTAEHANWDAGWLDRQKDEE